MIHIMSVIKRLYAILAVAVIITSVADKDWMWLMVAFAGLIIALYPKKNKEFEYNPILLISASILLFIQIVLGILIFFYDRIDPIWFVSLGVQTCVSAIYGYMLALLIDRFTDIKLSDRWILMFSLLFALSVSGVYLFFQFVSLYAAGYPVFNYELQGVVTNRERIWMNMQLMYPPTIATFVSLPAVATLRRWTKRNDISKTEAFKNE